jgi:hypothetical protein
MASAAARDAIAAEYVSDFALTFETGVPALVAALGDGPGSEAMSSFTQPPASRRHAGRAKRRRCRGAGVGRRTRCLSPEAAHRGRAAPRADTPREPGNALNPGTTADVVTATLFVALLEGILTLSHRASHFPDCLSAACSPIWRCARSASGRVDLGDLDCDAAVPAWRCRASLTALVDAAVRTPAGGVVYGASSRTIWRSSRGWPSDTRCRQRPQTLRARPAALAPAARRAHVSAHVGRGARRSLRWLRKPLRGGGGMRVRAWRAVSAAGGPCKSARRGRVLLGR